MEAFICGRFFACCFFWLAHFKKRKPVCARSFTGRTERDHKYRDPSSGNDGRNRKVRKKRMKKQLMLACLAFCLAFSSHSMAAEKNGWRSEAGGSVYYVKGTKAKGLKTIGSYTYYFKKEDGTLLKNRWLRYKGKYYYFQNRGRMVTKPLGRKKILCRKRRSPCHQSVGR